MDTKFKRIIFRGILAACILIILTQTCLSQGPYTPDWKQSIYYKPNGTTAIDANVVGELTPDQIIYETQSFIDSYPHFTVISPASTKYNCYGYALCIIEGSDTVNLGYHGSADIVNCFTLDASSVGCSFNEVSIANNPNIALLVYNNIPNECSHAAITVPGDNNMLISKMNFLPVCKHPKDQLPTYAGQLSLQYGTYHYYKRNYSMSLTGPNLVTGSATYTASYTNATFNRISWKVEPTELFQDSSGNGLIANIQLKTNPTYLADSATITFYLGHIAPSNNTLDTNSYRISKRFAVQIPTCTISGSDVKSEGFTVKPGATVTITGTIKNYEKAIIKVPVSATLVVNGGKLTNGTTNKMWQGIQVAGNKNLTQSTQNQGTLILQNGAIIEHSIIAIATYLNKKTATSGGIIKATNAIFRNNANAVTFWEYPASSSGRVSTNQSYFNNCTFIVNDNNLFQTNGVSFYNHAYLWKIYGVDFKGCDFANNITNSSNNGRAIYSLGSRFVVNESCIDPGFITKCNTCGFGNSKPSTFTGFYKAIEANADGQQYPFKTNQSNFSNNLYAIWTSGINNFLTTRLNIDFSNSQLNSSRGLRISASTGYKIEENVLIGAGNLATNQIGIMIYNTTSEENIIYRNEFKNTNTGVYITSEETVSSYPGTGLQLGCNYFSSNKYDIHVSKAGSIRINQGTSSKGADNDFSPNSTGYNIIIPSGKFINYYHSAGTNHIPTFAPNTVRLYNATANPCESTLCNFGTVIVDKNNKGDENNDLSTYIQLDKKYSSLLEIFYAKGYDKVLTDYANGIIVDEKILQAAMKMHEELLDISWQMKEISDDALQTIKSDSIYDLNQLRDWYEVINNLSAKYSLAEVFYQMGDYEKAFSVLTSIPKKFNLNEQQYFEHRNYLSFFEFKRDLHKSGRTYFDMEEDEINKLVNITKANTGTSSFMAQSVLCFFHDICIEIEEKPLDKSTSFEEKGEGNKDTSTSLSTKNGEVYVYPNPGSNSVTVLSYTEGQLEFVNSAGQIVMKCNVVKGSNSLDVSSLPKGVYVYRVTNNNSVSETGKWVKM